MSRASTGKESETESARKTIRNFKEILSMESLTSWSNSLTIHIILIVLLGFLVYSNTFNAPFLLDDNDSIVESPIIKDFSYFLEPTKASGLWIYNGFKSRFIGHLSFFLNYSLHGLGVRGFHLVNLFIHIFNSLLVYCLVYLTFMTPFLNKSLTKKYYKRIAFISAVLFVVHPIQTQAVTYIVQRVTSLATMFYLLSMVLYAKWRIELTARKKYIRLYLFSMLSCLLAIKTKEIAITLPIMITLYELMFFRGTLWKRTVYLAPLLLMILIIPIPLIDMGMPIQDIIGDVSEKTAIVNITRLDYLLTEFTVIVTYIKLLFMPVNQNLDYDYHLYHSFLEPQVFMSFLLLISVFGLGFYLLYRSRLSDIAERVVAFGIFWFFIALSVESGIVPLHPIYEHRVYLPSVGFFWR